MLITFAERSRFFGGLYNAFFEGEKKPHKKEDVVIFSPEEVFGLDFFSSPLCPIIQ